MRGYVIAIDGPAASGKGTIVQLLTEQLHGVNIYTGGMYRALALACLRGKIVFTDTTSVLRLLSTSEISLGDESNLSVVATIYLNGENVTEAIKTPEAAIGAGKVVQVPGVREEIVKRQKELSFRLVSKGKVVILDGQDTAMYVYPQAEVKIFLTASQEVRAKRRQKQYEKQGLYKSLDEMLREIKIRDHQDWSRVLHPLSSDPEKDGYFLVDSSDLNEYQTRDIILKKITSLHL
ncbi:MAG: (d)CMP kinase [Candidatus Levybacteria bacterium]|nr:(d)CMP kinase [Candidatus Levybacteria bacterium]